MTINQESQLEFEKKCAYKQESHRIRLSVMSDLGLKITPFTEHELSLMEKVEKGIATIKESQEAQVCFKEHEAEASTQSDMVDAYLFQCEQKNIVQLMIH